MPWLRLQLCHTRNTIRHTIVFLRSLPFTWGQWLKHPRSPINYLFVSVDLVPGLTNKTIYKPAETPREMILLRLHFLLPFVQTNDDVRT